MSGATPEMHSRHFVAWRDACAQGGESVSRHGYRLQEMSRALAHGMCVSYLPSLERCRHAVIAPELDDIVEHTHIADCKQVLRLLLDSVPSTLHSHGAG